MPTPVLPFDPTGIAPSNLVLNEIQILNAYNGINYHIIIPKAGPFFTNGFIITITVQGITRTLVYGIDYIFGHKFVTASLSTLHELYGSIIFLDITLSGILRITYQSVGDIWILNDNALLTILADTLHNPRITTWEMVANYPALFPPINHPANVTDLIGMTELLTAIYTLRDTALAKITAIQQKNITDGVLVESPVITWDSAVNGQITELMLTASRSMGQPINIKQRQPYAIRITQGGIGNNIITWNLAFKFGINGAPTLSTILGKVDWLEFIGGPNNTLEFITARLDAV